MKIELQAAKDAALRAGAILLKHYAEGFTFGNSGDIKIPAGGDQTLTSEWAAPIDMTIIEIATPSACMRAATSRRSVCTKSTSTRRLARRT